MSAMRRSCPRSSAPIHYRQLPCSGERQAGGGPVAGRPALLMAAPRVKSERRRRLPAIRADNCELSMENDGLAGPEHETAMKGSERCPQGLAADGTKEKC